MGTVLSIVLLHLAISLLCAIVCYFFMVLYEKSERRPEGFAEMLGYGMGLVFTMFIMPIANVVTTVWIAYCAVRKGSQ